MKPFAFIISVVCGFLVFQESKSLEWQSSTTSSQLSNYSIFTNIKGLVIPKGSELPSSVDDIMSLFGNRTWLSGLSLTGKQSAVTLLMSSCCTGLVTNQLPPVVFVNLINEFASTRQLFSVLHEPVLHRALTVITADGIALHAAVSPKVLVQFLNGLLSLSPGTLNDIPKSVLVPVLGSVRSANVLSSLLPSAVLNLVTTLSLSKPLFNCLPPATVSSLLSYLAKNPIKTPPSTVFGFYDGLLTTLQDSPRLFLTNSAAAPVLAAVIGPAMTSRLLSVLPVDVFDSLLFVLGSSQALSEALPVNKFVTVFSVLATSPKLLSSLNPIRLGGLIEKITACPTIMNGLPPHLLTGLMDSIIVYLPNSLKCIPNDAFESFVVRTTVV